MGVRKRGSVWYIDYYANGKRVREKVGASKKLALAVLAKRQTEVAENRHLDIQRRPQTTFDQLAEQYLEFAKVNKRSWDRDQLSIRSLSAAFGDKRLWEITSFMVENYKTARSKQVSHASVNRELACLKFMFTKAIEWDLASVNPVKRVKLFKENPGRVRYLEAREIQALLAACPEHLRPIVIVALNTGMRKGEILNLKWSDIDFIRCNILIRKSKNGCQRYAPMTKIVAEALNQVEKLSDYVFCLPNGDRRKGFRKSFLAALAGAGIEDFRFHDLRHTFASQLVMNGADLYTVKDLMGHQSIRMTERYSHLSPEHKKASVELLADICSPKMVTTGKAKVGAGA